MASNNFVFPPPPPPPPKHTNPQFTGASWNSAPNRGGRGGYGRGRGQSDRPRGDFRSTRGGGGNDNYNVPSRGPSRYETGPRGGGGGPSHFNQRGQKRRHDQAFQRQGRHDPASSAPPPVPSFGFEMPPANPRPTQTMSASTGSAAPQKRNALGLTPNFDDKSEQGDEDEEAKLAAQVSAGNSLEFTFRGQTASLSTPEDIASWIAERKKKFPTKAKAEAAKAKAQAEAEERAKRRAQVAEERQQRMQSNPGRGGRGGRQGRRDQKQPAKGQSEAEKLQLELAEARKRIAELEKKALETSVSQPRLESPKSLSKDPKVEPTIQTLQPSSDVEEDGETLSGASEEETSSEGSNDESSDEDDGPPVEESSRRQGPEKVPLPPRERKEQQVCREFTRFGKCSRGARCYFKHEPGDPSKNNRGRNAKNNAAGRKSLYQKLTEQQQEISDELVLQHILYLGDRGYLAEPEKGEEKESADQGRDTADSHGKRSGTPNRVVK